MKKFMLILALVGCSPTYYTGARIARAKNPCPTVTFLLGDFVLAGAALAVSVLKYNAGKSRESLAYAGAGMAISLGANLSETVCRR